MEDILLDRATVAEAPVLCGLFGRIARPAITALRKEVFGMGVPIEVLAALLSADPFS
ncbi:hypothetical protein [Streptomyces sp. NPDC097981]|uniref:hypothetical protein n=1 Tax=Streptomyces sp. NPDC097981 TaxID=3155428 RepID=UPI003323E680